MRHSEAVLLRIKASKLLWSGIHLLMLTLQSNVIGLFLKKSSLLFPHLTLYLAFFLLSGHLFLIPPRHPILFPYPHTSPLPPIVTFLVTVDESESGRHRASTPSRPVNMHANVALDISTTAHSGWERGTCGLLCESGGWYGWETGDETERKLIEWETTIGTDSVMPLCVILSLQVETSVAGPLATWELSLRAEPGEWT